jgi:hypothetical protein
MFNPTKQALSMYMPFVANMAKDSPSLMVVHVNFELLCDVNLFISLSYLNVGHYPCIDHIYIEERCSCL